MIETCGSYRRLKSSCGDIDMLITFKDGRKHIHETVLAPLIDQLKAIGNNNSIKIYFNPLFFFCQGFLTDDLTNHSETSSSTSTGNVSEQMTYFGVCRLPESGSLVNIYIEDI
jgi:DNA polymerase lambda